MQTSFDVYHAIGDVMAAERGRFFFDQQGNVVLWKRHLLLQSATPLVSIDDSTSELVEP